MRKLLLPVAVTVSLMMALFAVKDSSAATDQLPDLGMARVTDIRIVKTNDGRRLLQFSTTMVNVGAGPFEVYATRPDTSTTTWSVSQRIYTDTGSYLRPISLPLVLGGDGHLHWHLRDLAAADLIRLDNGSKVGTSNKRGFCFWDNVEYRLTLPGAPASAVYGEPGCGRSTSTVVSMGLSVGWGDIYPSTLPDQNIDITGLVAGRYRLQLTVDNNGQFVEVSESNNVTWVDLQIKAQGNPKIVGYGPTA
jgi:hypothetical protein